MKNLTAIKHENKRRPKLIETSTRIYKERIGVVKSTTPVLLGINQYIKGTESRRLKFFSLIDRVG